MMTLLRFLLYYITISAEKFFGYLIPISFERSTRYLKKNYSKSIRNISSRLSIAEVKKFKVYSVIGNEAGKDQYVTGIEVVYVDQNHQRQESNLVIKFLSSRSEPIYLSALKSAVYKGLNQEVTFYKELSEKIPFRTPKCVFAASVPLLYRGVVVMEKLSPDQMVDDYIGCATSQSQSVIESISKMHAKFWNRVSNDSSLEWLPSKHPLGSFWFLDYISRKEKSCLILWKALYNYFSNHPLSVVHGDCRPGNIMWFDDGTITMLDWQFANAGIGTWDFTYFVVMAHEMDVRRNAEKAFLDQYYNNLCSSYKDFHQEEFPYSKEMCTLDFHILKLVLGLYGWAALVSKMFDKYGNDPRDVRCWADRITAAVVELDSAYYSNLIKTPVAIIDDFKVILKNASDETKERFVCSPEPEFGY